ncbi:hypothetical protein BACCIP111883_02118 [Sutcliffiella rhizosphaerae]|uniref:Uncharacterized protein n=1 Tax=Sutcliffiella rhizosphaerae TaxID=2880967 RepID=A0ABM8YMX4_9BACI|nr:hypothetical protein BACCIP111883_02118 [Sutcliffiella rhizosphaerae]
MKSKRFWLGAGLRWKLIVHVRPWGEKVVTRVFNRLHVVAGEGCWNL